MGTKNAYPSPLKDFRKLMHGFGGDINKVVSGRALRRLANLFTVSGIWIHMSDAQRKRFLQQLTFLKVDALQNCDVVEVWEILDAIIGTGRPPDILVPLVQEMHRIRPRPKVLDARNGTTIIMSEGAIPDPWNSLLPKEFNRSMDITDARGLYHDLMAPPFTALLDSEWGLLRYAITMNLLAHHFRALNAYRDAQLAFDRKSAAIRALISKHRKKITVCDGGEMITVGIGQIGLLHIHKNELPRDLMRLALA